MDNSSCDFRSKPTVGFFVDEKVIKHFKDQVMSNRLNNLIRAIEISKVNLYFFCLQDVDLYIQKITGTYYCHNSGLWSKKKFSYPDVLYVRTGAVLQKEKISRFYEQLGKKKAKKINSGPAFNKWKVINVLKRNEQLTPHLLPTMIHSTGGELTLMLKRYNEVYLKACRGRKGKQVMRVKKLGRGYYEYRYFRDGRLYKDVLNFKNLSIKIKKFFQTRPFIIQKAINLPKLNESIYDMRAELQRNGQGELEVLEILVRVARPGSPITQHASSYLYDDFFSNIKKYSTDEIAALKNNIKKFLVNVYRTVETAYGSYGEIGIDFAIDQEGYLWFIECNSKSTKVSLFKAASDETKLRSYLNLFEYAIYLSERQEEGVP